MDSFSFSKWHTYMYSQSPSHSFQTQYQAVSFYQKGLEMWQNGSSPCVLAKPFKAEYFVTSCFARTITDVCLANRNVLYINLYSNKCSSSTWVVNIRVHMIYPPPFFFAFMMLSKTILALILKVVIASLNYFLSYMYVKK